MPIITAYKSENHWKYLPSSQQISVESKSVLAISDKIFALLFRSCFSALSQAPINRPSGPAGPEGRFIGAWLSAEKQDLNNRANILSEIARTDLLSTEICCEDGRYFQ